MRKNLLSTIAIAVLLTTSSINAFAETPSASTPTPVVTEQQPIHKFDHKSHFEKISQKLSKELNLTAEQEEKAKLLREEGHKKIEPLMKEMKALRKKMDELRKENMSEFEKILTPEQLDKFKKIKEEGKEKFHKKHHRRPFFDNK